MTKGSGYPVTMAVARVTWTFNVYGKATNETQEVTAGTTDYLYNSQVVTTEPPTNTATIEIMHCIRVIIHDYNLT